MGYFEFFVHFYLKNHPRLVKFSYLNFAPLNLYPTTETADYKLQTSDTTYGDYIHRIHTETIETT